MRPEGVVTYGEPGASNRYRQKIEALMITTAAENDHYSKNDDPGAVVVKDVAKTVVIHMFLQGCH